MQYTKPDGNFFIGDPMPFFHAGVFHFYYLLDRDHHAANNGMGGHQIAHLSSPDLVHWQQHPLALPTGAPGEVDENSICTGDFIVHNGVWHCFYATRRRDGGPEAPITQHVCQASGTDGCSFVKAPNNPILNPRAGYTPRHFRDPRVFAAADGLFHMLVTAQLAEEAVCNRNGAIAHLTSEDLVEWRWKAPLLVPGLNTAPECPDYFQWNDWYYLTFLTGGVLKYRMSRKPFGPWLRPRLDTLDGPELKAMKSAPFHGGRRIGAGFLGSKEGYQDQGRPKYAGNAVFREYHQNPDGTLHAAFPREMQPQTGPVIPLQARPVRGGLHSTANTLVLDCPDSFGVAATGPVPPDARLSMTVIPDGTAPHFGLCLRGSGKVYERGNELRFSPAENRVQLRNLAVPAGDQGLFAVHGLDRPFSLEIYQQGSLTDICIAGSRTLVQRLYDNQGDQLWWFCENGWIEFRDVEIAPLQ